MRIAILYLSPYMPEPRTHKQARSLIAAGHQVTVYALWRPGQAETEINSGYQIKRVRLLSGNWHGQFLAPFIKFIEFNLRVFRENLRQPPQWVQANDARALPLGWLIKRTTSASLLYDARELETGQEFGNFRLASLYRRLWPLPEKIWIHTAKAVVTVSAAIASELSQLYGIRMPVVVMNCPEISSSPFQPLNPVNRLRWELNIPASEKMILYQGSLTAGRGLQPFFESIQLLPGTAGIALGDGPELNRLRNMCKSEGWQRVYLPGRVPVDDLPSYTACADLGVVLTQNTCRNHYLTLPNKLFEYIHAGIPVVGSNMLEITRILREVEIGEVVDPDDPHSIAAGIRRLLENPQLYRQAQENSRRAASVLNWERESTKYTSIFMEQAREQHQ